MREIEFSFSTGKVGSRVSKIVKVEDTDTDDEIDFMLNEWLLDKSGATWREINKATQGNDGG